MKQINYLAIGLVIIAVAARFLPHPPNFAPVGAVALFTGAYFNKRWSYLIPFAIMLISDLLIGFYLPTIMAAVYISFIISVWLGSLARKQKTVKKIFFLSLTGSIIFFLITNTAVWLFSSMYEHSLIGLSQSYYFALPFFRNTVLSDLFYTGALFGLSELVRSPRLALKKLNL